MSKDTQFILPHTLDIPIKNTIFALCFFGNTRHCWKERASSNDLDIVDFEQSSYNY